MAPTNTAAQVISIDGITQDFLHLVQQSDNEVIGWISPAGYLHGSLAPPSPLLVGSLVATANTQDTITIPGALPTSSVSLTATNPVAAAMLASGDTYVSAKGTNEITITHSPIAGATFDIVVAN